MLGFMGLSGRSGSRRRAAVHVLKRLWLLAIIIVFAAGTACRRSEPSGSSGNSQAVREITVSAAASLKDAFGEIGKQYESRTGSKVNFNFGASGALQKQIESGAPVDVFASAGRPQMDALVSQGLIEPGTQRDFTRNVLVLIVPADSTSGPTSFTDLGGAKVTRLAVGNPKTTPVGQYAAQTLTRLGLWQGLQSRLILAEDVRQTLDYVARGEVDAGIVYASDVRSSDNKVRKVATAPADLHNPILYPIAVVRASSSKDAARAFIDAVTNDDGQRTLEKYGFERAR
ncbi:MAG TPA: molybdate ABC transporter substrate-binding protein [Blastocatellia bacterium]|nr:molybdate ABC transporter substrate-binding protein [Blastocatellia bacterium]